MREECFAGINNVSRESSNLEFLKDDRFIEFLNSKDVNLDKYLDVFIEIWKLPKDLYITFHNSFNHDSDRTKRDFNNDLKNETKTDNKKLLQLLLILLDDLDPSAVGQLLKVFREIKRNVR